MSDPIPLSALQHYLFCPRQCALIHVERQWAENRLTAEGRILHEAADVPAEVSRREVRIAHGMPIASAALGVAGIADVVELRRAGRNWQPYPVEYKRGRPKAHRADEVQLCAQAICLEEMFHTSVPEGALFYGQTRRRTIVAFDDSLRTLTRTVCEETRSMIEAERTPAPVWEKRRCAACSLIDLCRPKMLDRPRQVHDWLARQITAEEEV
ncbi:MAG: CRISPR-associated protein Cas4 [Rhodospirillales bacterium]|nr:CRISPR-associated protein Cas4 [Rhodospirillales bacterium]